MRQDFAQSGGGCLVNHDERRAMGLLACYHCDAPLQTLDEANMIRRSKGLELLGYPAPTILRRLGALEDRVTALELGQGEVAR